MDKYLKQIDDAVDDLRHEINRLHDTLKDRVARIEQLHSELDEKEDEIADLEHTFTDNLEGVAREARELARMEGKTYALAFVIQALETMPVDESKDPASVSVPPRLIAEVAGR